MRRAIVAACIAIATACIDCAAADPTMSGELHNATPGVVDGRAQFTCSGMPTCVGVVNVSDQHPQCSNGFNWNATVSFNGVDLSHPGTFGGTVTLSTHL